MSSAEIKRAQAGFVKTQYSRFVVAHRDFVGAIRAYQLFTDTFFLFT
jgi:hypothetical protein